MTPCRFRQLRPDYLEMTGGNACAALMLDLFAYWTNVRTANSAQAESGGKEGNDLWFYRSLADISADLFGAFGRAAIRSALKLLEDSGLIESRTNPASPWDRTLQYRLTERVGNRILHDAKPDDVQDAKPDDDAGARPSQPSAARSDVVKQEEKKEDEIVRKPVTYGGHRVEAPIVDRAEALIGLFNEECGRRLNARKRDGGASPHLTQVVGALLDNPDATLGEWTIGLRMMVADPPSWVAGRAIQLGDIFGGKASAYTLTPPDARVAPLRALNGNGKPSPGQLLSEVRAANPRLNPDLRSVPQLPRST